MKNKLLILGAGISGLSAGFHYKNITNESPIILEKRESYGGLLDSIIIDNFTFDNFVHFSFTKDEYVKSIFAASTKFISHEPKPYNFTNGLWIKHPLQNNLKKLPLYEKAQIIIGFILRPTIINPSNYEEWLISQYGRYFYKNYPYIYTLKYWRTQPRDMEVKWVGNRMYKPSLIEILKGSFFTNTSDVYYAKEMRYPVSGGFKSFLNHIVIDLDIHYFSEVKLIDIDSKIVTCSNGKIYQYERLISSLPLPVYLGLIDNLPSNIVNAIKKLKWTSAIIISMGFNIERVTDKLWFYIYDKDVRASRIHSPSMKSPNNAPEGCSSLQSELYFLREELSELSIKEMVNQEIITYIRKGFFRKEDLIFYKYKVVEYANVIFDHNIYEAREIVRNWLAENNIETIGRFGQWEYYWSDDSFSSGKLSINSKNPKKPN